MLTFEPVEHKYSYAGNRVYSVTQILNEWLKIRVQGFEYYVHTVKGTVIPAHIFEAAGDHGTAAHSMLEIIVTGGIIDESLLDPDLLPTLRQIELFKRDHIEETILTEVPLYSKKYVYAGTPDWFGKLKGIKYMVCLDLKTGMYDMVAEQISAYEQLIREETGYRGIIKHYCLPIPKNVTEDSVCNPIEVTQRGAFKFFLGKLNEHKYLRG